MLKFSLAAALIAATFATGTATAGAAIDYGTIVADQAGQRIIRVTADTRSINVTNGETVTIATEAGSFTWHVDTFPHEGQFDLSKVAPASAMVDGVTVYVSPNPTYFGA